MQRKLTKMICMGVMLIMCVGFLCACNNNDDNPYNAVVYDYVTNKLNTDYLWENSTQGTQYKDEFLEFDTRPKSNTKVIKNQAQFNEAFYDFPIDINFDKEMIILYFHTGDIIEVSNKRIFEYKIKTLEIIDKTLNIVISKKKLVDGPTGSPPVQECVAIKMSKCDIDTVNNLIVYV